MAASEGAGAMGYFPDGWYDRPCGEVAVRQYTIRLAAASERAFRRVLDDLRWGAGIDTLSARWGPGEGEALVECFGDLDTVLRALDATGRAGDVLAIGRA